MINNQEGSALLPPPKSLCAPPTEAKETNDCKKYAENNINIVISSIKKIINNLKNIKNSASISPYIIDAIIGSLEDIVNYNERPGRLIEIMEHFTSLCLSTGRFVRYFRLLTTGKEEEVPANFEKLLESLSKIVKLLYNINTYIANLLTTRKVLEELFYLSQRLFPDQRILAVASSSPALINLAVRTMRDSICCCNYIAYEAAYRTYRSMEPYLKGKAVKLMSYYLLSIFYSVSNGILQEWIHG